MIGESGRGESARGLREPAHPALPDYTHTWRATRCRSARRRQRSAQNRQMSKPLDATALLSSAAMIARKVDTYLPETYVIDLAELRQIIFEMRHDSEVEAG